MNIDISLLFVIFISVKSFSKMILESEWFCKIPRLIGLSNRYKPLKDSRGENTEGSWLLTEKIFKLAYSDKCRNNMGVISV